MDPYQTEPRPSIAKPVIIGGLVGGILGLIPGIFYCNCCCCLWYALAGVISALVYRSMAPHLLTTGIGGLLGLVSGFVSGVISSIGLYFIFGPVITRPEFFDPNSDLTQDTVKTLRDVYEKMGMQPEEIDTFVDQYLALISSMTPESVLANFIVSLVMLAIIGIIVSIVAGMITAAVAGKKQRYPDEPPPYEPVS